MSSSSKRRKPQPRNSPMADGGHPADAMQAPMKPVPPPAPRAEEKLGDILRRVREHRNEPLDYISDYLRIRPNFLASIENSRYDELPADAYVIGFLRTYANYLGLDGKAAIDQYRKEMAGRRRKPQLSMPQPVSEGRAPTVAILILAVILALLVYAVWYGLSSADRAVVNVAPTMPVVQPTLTQAAEPSAMPVATPVAVNPVSSPAAATAPAAIPSPALLPATATATASPVTPPASASFPPPPAVVTAPAVTAPKPPDAAATPVLPAGQVFGATMGHPKISLRAEKESWVLVFDRTGATLFDHILKPGDIYNVPDIKGLMLTTGNGGGVTLTVNGIELPKLSGDSRIVRNVPLDADALKARLGNGQ